MRSRNIKPGFFVNDELAEIAPLGRLLFIGLWTLADREGRLEDRPRKIKAAVLPFDDCNADEILGELEARAFLVRYESGGRRYIEITNFCKHQNPHVKEQPSAIPAPDRHGASTVQVPDKEPPQPEQAGLIPDSLLLIPDSSSSANKGSRFALTHLPDEWALACKEIRADLNPSETFESFRDYWIAQPGIKGRKTDWLATWRNWVRNQRRPVVVGADIDAVMRQLESEQRV